MEARKPRALAHSQFPFSGAHVAQLSTLFQGWGGVGFPCLPQQSWCPGSGEALTSEQHFLGLIVLEGGRICTHSLCTVGMKWGLLPKGKPLGDRDPLALSAGLPQAPRLGGWTNWLMRIEKGVAGVTGRQPFPLSWAAWAGKELPGIGCVESEGWVGVGGMGPGRDRIACVFIWLCVCVCVCKMGKSYHGWGLKWVELHPKHSFDSECLYSWPTLFPGTNLVSPLLWLWSGEEEAQPNTVHGGGETSTCPASGVQVRRPLYHTYHHGARSSSTEPHLPSSWSACGTSVWEVRLRPVKASTLDASEWTQKMSGVQRWR